MTADARPGLQDIHSRMPVRQSDHFPYVDAHVVRDKAKFVGKRDIDVAKGVLGQLGHFCRAGIGGHAGTAHEPAVEGERLSRASWRDAADHPIIVDEFNKDAAGKYAFGAVGDGVIRAFTHAGRAKIRAQPRQQVADLLGRANRRGRFENDGIAGLKHLGDL